MKVPGVSLRAACVFVAAGTLLAQARDQRSASVGMRAEIQQIVLPGTELEPVPANASSPVVVRVLQVWPHGDRRRYDLEWSGLEPGQFDLTKFLRRKDGSSIDGLPALLVDVASVLPKGQNEPSELPAKPAERLDGYRAWQIAAAIGWGVGLVLILFVGRRFRRRPAPPPRVPTLADRLRPLVEAVAGNRADTAAKAELERLLVAFWRARLDLAKAKAADAIVAIRRHPEAGVLVRQVEAWLHMQAPPASLDLGTLLAPYRHVTAASFDAAPGGAKAS